MKQKDDSTWQRNAGSQIVLASIFAALAGIWITVGLTEHIGDEAKFVVVGFSLFSFFFLAVSAEGTTTAFDEKDALKFVYYLLWYNIGVVFLGAAIAALIFGHFNQNFVRFVGSTVWCVSPNFIRGVLTVVYALLFFVLLWHWIRDAFWIYCADTADFNKYLCELNDDAQPELHRRRIMRIIFGKRIRNEPATS